MTDEGPTTDDTMLAEERDPRSSWKGRGVEALVAAHCLLTCGGRLNVSTPMVDDSGTDLIFHLRGQPATLAVQVKTRFTSAL